jgi:hypothetical protein
MRFCTFTATSALLRSGLEGRVQLTSSQPFHLSLFAHSPPLKMPTIQRQRLSILPSIRPLVVQIIRYPPDQPLFWHDKTALCDNLEGEELFKKYPSADINEPAPHIPPGSGTGWPQQASPTLTWVPRQTIQIVQFTFTTVGQTLALSSTWSTMASLTYLPGNDQTALPPSHSDVFCKTIYFFMTHGHYGIFCHFCVRHISAVISIGVSCSPDWVYSPFLLSGGRQIHRPGRSFCIPSRLR